MPIFAADFTTALPEIVLGIGICAVLLVDLFLTERTRDVTYFLALAVLGAAALAVGEPGSGGRVLAFDGSYVSDPLARLLKLFVLAVIATVFLYSRAYLRDRGLNHGEYYLLGLFAALGTLAMISAHSLLTMYLGLETLSLALYAMVAFDRDSPVAAEAAMKYFVLGAIASGCLLYGISLVYGVTGALEFPAVAEAVARAGSGDIAVAVGVAFMLVGIAFKFGAVPFHMWLPDVYQGAPTSVTLFIGTAAKVGAFALAVRILGTGLAPLVESWTAMLAILGVLSLSIGNVLAIVQTNVKRMLAYSTISHVGFIVIALAAGTDDGTRAGLFYTVVYVLMAAAAFGIVILLGRRGVEADAIEDFRGLNQRSPWFAAVMLIVMFSMIGVPPLAGFYAKWAVLAALIDADQAWLAVAGVVFSVIGAFYYLRIVKLMYFDEAAEPAELRQAPDLRWVVSLNGLAVLAVGLFPDALIEACGRAIG